jgi:hypothetical protein
MRGDQLARQWRVIRTIEARLKELSAAEIARPDEIGILTEQKPFKSLFQKLGWVFFWGGIEANIFSATVFIVRP